MEIFFSRCFKEGFKLKENPVFVNCVAVYEAEAIAINHRGWTGMGKDIKKQSTGCQVRKSTQVCNGRCKFDARTYFRP